MNIRIMRNILAAVIAFIAVMLNAVLLTAHAEILTPASGKPLALIIGDAESPYYRLDVGGTTTVNATGPGTLRLMVRFSIPAGSPDNPKWKLQVTEAGKTVTTIDTVCTPSEAAWKDSPARPAKAFKRSFLVPAGQHQYQLMLTSPIHSFAGIRYLFSEGTVKKKKSAVYPTEMLGSTAVSIKENVIDFFLADSTRPVVVRVNGPTRLRIVTRLAYGGTMKGPQKYAVRTMLDGKEMPLARLTTSKSPATDFTNHKEWSVGESKTIYLEIPAGAHTVVVRPSATAAPALAVRFTIPEEDIEN